MRRLVAQTSLGATASGAADVRRRRHRRNRGPSLRCRGSYQHTRDSLRKAAAEAVAAGVGGLMLFGVPRDEDKDATGSAGVAEDGILNVALRDLAADLGDATVLMADTCLDEFTDHGHCGVLGRPRAGRQRRHQRAVRRTCCGASGFGCPRGGSERDDGRSGRGDPRRSRRRGPHRRGDPRLRGEVRLGLLRPVPRGGRARAWRATGAPISRTRATRARRCTRSNSTSTRAPTS